MILIRFQHELQFSNSFWYLRLLIFWHWYVSCFGILTPVVISTGFVWWGGRLKWPHHRFPPYHLSGTLIDIECKFWPFHINKNTGNLYTYPKCRWLWTFLWYIALMCLLWSFYFRYESFSLNTSYTWKEYNEDDVQWFFWHVLLTQDTCDVLLCPFVQGKLP